MKSSHPPIKPGSKISSCPVMGSFLPTIAGSTRSAIVSNQPSVPQALTSIGATPSVRTVTTLIEDKASITDNDSLTEPGVIASSASASLDSPPEAVKHKPSPPSLTSDGSTKPVEDPLTTALKRIPVKDTDDINDPPEDHELMRARLALYEEQLRLDESRASFTVDVTSKNIVAANDAACAMFGIMREELGKRNVNTLIPEGPVRQAHDIKINDYVSKWRSTSRRPASRFIGGETNELIAVRQKEDGRFETFPITMRLISLMTSADSFGVPTLFTALVLDMSLLRRYQADVYSYKFIAHSVVYSPIIEINMFGIITKANISAVKLFGFANLLGRNVSILIHNTVHRENHDYYLSYVREAMTAGMFNPENSRILEKSRDLVARHAEGYPIPVTLTAHLLHDPNCGNDHRYIGVFVDKSEFILRREFEEKLRLKVMPSKASFEPKLLTNAVVISLDMINSTIMFAGKTPEQVLALVRPVFEKVTEIAKEFCVEPVKFNGDGAIIMASELDNFDELLPHNRATRAVLFSIAFYLWAEVAKYNIRIGIAVGDVMAYSINLSDDRVNWEIASADEPIPAADRYQKSACASDLGALRQIQIAEKIFLHTVSKLRSYFKAVEHSAGSLKGIMRDTATGEAQQVKSYVLNLAKIHQEKSSDPSSPITEKTQLPELIEKYKGDLENTVSNLRMRQQQMRIARARLTVG